MRPAVGEGVVSYDSEQIFKDQFEGQPVAWKGLLKSIDPLSYDRYFKGKEGFWPRSRFTK